MKDKKITPQQALDAIRWLIPETKTIHKVQRSWTRLDTEFWMRHTADIDWPEGITQWPPPKPVEKWRRATVHDVNPIEPVRCRCRDILTINAWAEGLLIGVVDDVFIVVSRNKLIDWWKYCEVLDDLSKMGIQKC